MTGLPISLEELLTNLSPYIYGMITDAQAATSGGAHELGGPMHTGQLLNSQAPQFLLTDGSRNLLDNLGVADGKTIDGVDISDFYGDFVVHTNATAAAGHAGIGAHNHQSTLNGGLIDHALGLTNVGPDQHHAQKHNIIGTDHSFSGSAMDLVGATLDNTLGKITPSSDPGTASKILKTDATGLLALKSLSMHGQMASDDWTSQTTGWGIAKNGSADFRYLFTGELHAKSFIVDMEQALAGGQIICKSVAVLAEEFLLPSAGGSVTIKVEDLPGLLPVYQNGDIVGVCKFTRSEGQLIYAMAWGTVSGCVHNGDGTQSWTFTRSSGSNAGTATGYIAKGTLVRDFGTSGMGYYEVSAIDGLWGSNSPYAQIVTWTGHPASGSSLLSRWGKLSGIAGMQSDEYGLYLNKSSTEYAKLSNKSLLLRGIDMQMWNGASQTVQIEPDGDVKFGNDVSTDAGTSFKHIAASGNIDLGQYSSGAQGLFWNKATGQLALRGSQIIGSNIGFDVGNALLYLTFDSVRLANGNYKENFVSHNGIMPTVTGGALCRPGKFAQAGQCGAEATTNYFKWDSSFENGTTGTQPSYFNGGVVSEDYAYYGKKSWKITTAATTYASAIFPLGAANTSTSTSCWAYSPAGCTLQVGLTDNVDSWVSVTTVTIPAGVWTRVTTTGTVDAHYTGVAVFANMTSGSLVYIDAIQVEQKAYATPYCDGSLGSGYSWSGTAYASTSSRTETHLAFARAADYIKSQGSISCWAQRLTVTSGNEQGILDASSDWSSNRFNLYLNSAGNAIAELGSKVYGHPTVIGVGNWAHIVLTWGSGTYTLYVNGTAGTSQTFTFPTLGANLGVGWLQYLASRWNNSLIDDLFILDRVLAADEVSSLYASGKAALVRGGSNGINVSEPSSGGWIATDPFGLTIHAPASDYFPSNYGVTFENPNGTKAGGLDNNSLFGVVLHGSLVTIVAPDILFKYGYSQGTSDRMAYFSDDAGAQFYSSMSITGAFGCNGATPRGKASVNAEPYAAYSAADLDTPQEVANAINALSLVVRQIRTALLNDGILG